MAKTVSSFNTTFTPTNRYGFCRVPDGNGSEGTIDVNRTPFHLRQKREIHHYKDMY